MPWKLQFTGVHLRTSQKRAPKPFNSCEPSWTFPITSGKSFPKISEHFRRFPKILKNHKHLKITFEPFPKISEHFWRFSENFKIMKTFGKHFWTVSEVFQKFRKLFKLQKRVWSVSEVFGNSRRFPSSSKNFHKFSED